MINRVKIMILLIAIILLLMAVLMPIMGFKDWYQWWKINDPKNEYNCFSLTDIAYFQNNVLIYHILNQFGDGRRKFKYDFWIYLITGFMMGNAKGIVPGGFVTPKTLCYSLVPDTFPQNGLCYADGGLPKNQWPTDLDDWRSVIAKWGEITFKENGQEQCYHVDADKWFSNGDNFLAKWGIAPDSPIIIGFLTDWDMYNGAKTWVKAMNPLLGKIEGDGSGGWWGFLQYGDDFGGNGLLEINRIVWSEIPQWVDKGQNNGKKCDPTSSVTGGIGGAGIGAMIGMAIAGAICEVGSGGLCTPLIVAGAAAVAGVGAGVGTAAASGCL